MNIFYFVCFLKPLFFTNITSPGAKKTQGFARCLADKVEKNVHFSCPPLSLRLRITCSLCYLLSLTNFLLTCCYQRTTRLPSLFCHPPATASTYHYLSLPATTTCHILPLPTSFFHRLYLPLPAFFSRSLPATTCHCLPQSDTTPTCHYLPLPATACYYLLLPDYQLLPLLAIICHNLSAGPVAESATTETIQQTRMPNNLNRFLLENSFRQRISSSWFVF